MPLALSRIDADGNVQHSDSLYFLSIDNTLGGMPDCVPNEITPHIIRGYADAPDAPPPFVWLYPLDEYDALGKGGKRLEKMYFEDWYVRSEVNHGLPLSGVVSSANFLSSLAKKPALYSGSVLVATVPAAGSPCEEELCAHVESGGQVMLYGALAPAVKRLLSLLGLSCGEPIWGECELHTDGLTLDPVDSPCSRMFLHDPLVSDGGLCAMMPGDRSVRTLARAQQGGQGRVIAASRSLPSWQGGKVVWLRGTGSHIVDTHSNLPKSHDPRRYYPIESLARAALREFGYGITFARALPEQRVPAIMLHRCENAFFFSGYCPDTTVALSLRFPLGAPLLLGYETFLRDGYSTYHLPRAWRHECRVFVSQQDSAEPLKCVEDTCCDSRYRRHLRVRGLNHATVYVFPYPGYEEKTKLICGVERYDADRDGAPFEKELVHTPWGFAWKCSDITGTLSYYTELRDDVLW
jgi:hypothetical protein